MSKPRPIHTLHRDLRQSPDEGEPSFSYEDGLFDGGYEDDEDKFHRRLQSASHRRESNERGSSFWRTSGNASMMSETGGNISSPSLQSMSISSAAAAGGAGGVGNNTNNSMSHTSAAPGGPSLLTQAMQQQPPPPPHHRPREIPGSGKKKNGVTASPQHQWNQQADVRRHDSGMSDNSSNSRSSSKKKKKQKGRAAERRYKLDAQFSDIDIGHIVDEKDKHDVDTEEDENGSNGNNNKDVFVDSSTLSPSVDFKSMRNTTSALDRSSSDQSTGSLLYCKTPSSGSGNGPHGYAVTGMLGNSSLGKSSSLIFPTGVDSVNSNVRQDSETVKRKRRKINLCLDQCESIRFPFKKKLMLNGMDLNASDIPMKDLCGTALGNSLHKLSLSGNKLGAVPPKLLQSFPVLKTLDMSQCELHQLPDHWNLPKLTRLNLSHNRFTEFPEESMLEGLPELQELNMYGNKVAEITIPGNPKLLSKLEMLDLGYNDLVFLPDELDQFKSLRTLKVMNNFLAKVPMRVCDMDLKLIDVSSNPVTEPPIETCERGICSMRRYWHCIRMEEQSKKRALAEVQKKLQKQTKKSYGRFINSLKGAGPPSLRKPSSGGSVTDSSLASAPATLPLSTSTTLKASASSTETEERPIVRSVVPENEPVEAKVSAFVPEEAKPVDAASSPSLDQVDIKPIEAASSEPAISMTESIAGTNESVSLGDLIDDTLRDQVTVNDTLKVIFVGMAMVGKTSMIKRLIEGKDAVVPTRDERTVGVDIYDWEPKNDKRFEHIDSRIQFQDKQLAELCGDVDVKFSVWDFAGQHVYHATHELFFSSRALYVLVWDMGATNTATLRQKTSSMTYGETGAFKLYDSSDGEDDESDDEADLAAEEEERRADRALEHDIDEKVQFWVDCIQSTTPGAAILPVASFDDVFSEKNGGEAEAKRRCSVLKQRLLKHEERRIGGIKQRLQEFHDQNRADDIAAIRLRKLLCSYTRPKLIFGDDDNSVVRVSGTKYTGFDQLTEKIMDIATGRNKGQMQYPIFHGHVGARIPRMRLEVREAVRRMRGRFKVVEWGYFINVLRDHGLTNVEDISDALHFLTNTGELSYFGGVLTSSQQPPRNPVVADEGPCGDDGVKCTDDGTSNPTSPGEDDDDDVDEDEWTLSMDDTSITAPSTADGSLSTLEEFTSTGLSQFIFLNPRWLVAAVACILRHDLDREIKETRRLVASGGKAVLSRTASFYDARLNCPVITAEDACLLWQYKRITKKAAERAQEYSNNMTVTPFEFLQLLLIRFGVFVPIDLTIEKAFFGGKEYKELVENMKSGLAPVAPIIIDTDQPSAEDSPKFFFLPSLLGPSEPSEAWSYKSTDSWKTTLCHSILFPDGVPPGLMERLTACVLSHIYAVSRQREKDPGSINDALQQESATYEGHLFVKEIYCWRTAFYIKLGTQVTVAGGAKEKPKESIVEIFTHLAGRESRLCVGSDFMGVGMRRLIASGRGQAGDGGRKIWKGGYLLLIKCIMRVMATYEGLEYEKQGFCPVCLAKKAVSEASSWDAPTIRSAAINGELSMRCRHGHRVDTRLLAGPFSAPQKEAKLDFPSPAPIVSVKALAGAVVIVGLWDGETRRVARVGSGFIVDKKRGLIVTAAHTLMNIWEDKSYPYGVDYYGKKLGRVVIGVIPGDGEGAVFRYFAQIVSKDPGLDRGVCHVDACVLRITTRMENDVGGDGEGCGDEPEILLLHDQRALKKEQLQALKMTQKCELEEEVRIVGFNQGGGGLLNPGEKLNRYIDFAKGYVCMQFVNEDVSEHTARQRFKPREEIVAICPTIGGHSGGPCVNQQGEVIGILSRADSQPAQNGRCYLVPASELKVLVSKAKKAL